MQSKYFLTENNKQTIFGLCTYDFHTLFPRNDGHSINESHLRIQKIWFVLFIYLFTHSISIF